MKKTIAFIVLLFVMAMTYGQNTKILKMKDGKDTVSIEELYLMDLIQNADVQYRIDTTFKKGLIKKIQFTFKDTSKFRTLHMSSNEIIQKNNKPFKIKYIELDSQGKSWNISPRNFKRMKYLTIKLNDFLIRY
ncbi:MAG: hypothetical protein WC875_04750 [Candidatus Absconditabacterales bacterium]|jgi:hypothetical protein